MEQTAFQIQAGDNVATALSVLEPGTVAVLAGMENKEITCLEEIPCYHKIALRDIAEGEIIIKYGVPIGCATSAIAQGSWVHLHVMRSLYDERSNHLDIHTGAPKDTRYE